MTQAGTITLYRRQCCFVNKLAAIRKLLATIRKLPHLFKSQPLTRRVGFIRSLRSVHACSDRILPVYLPFFSQL
jgi:hypothetical protein